MTEHKKENDIQYILHEPNNKGLLIGILTFLGALVGIAMIHYLLGGVDFDKAISLLIGFIIGILGGFFIAK